MKKFFFFILFAALSLTIVAQETTSASLPKWFLQPEEYMYIGISEPNGDVQEAINMALMHYLMYHNFHGELKRTYMRTEDSGMTISSEENILKFDTTVHYSIEDIISTPQGEYICRISEKPNLTRRIGMSLHTQHYIEKSKERKDVKNFYYCQCFYEDATGKSTKKITLKEEASRIKINRNRTSSYTSQYIHDNGVRKEYTDTERRSLCEQLISKYLLQLEGEFVYTTKDDEITETNTMLPAYHQAKPFRFEYNDGFISVIPQ